MAGASGMVVRISGNIDDLKKALEEGTLVIQRTMSAAERLSASFTGEKLIASAKTATAEINRLGIGILNASESSKYLDLLDRSMDKLLRTGKEIPPDMMKLAAQLRNLHPPITETATATTSLLSKLGPLASALGITFSVAAVVNFGRELLADADAMVKLSDKTGIAIEPLQQLKYAAEQSGNTLDQVTTAVSMMQNKLAGGDASAVAALKDLGIEFAAFLALSPDMQFREVAEAVKKIEDPMLRAQVATDLFGKSGRELLPTLRADIDALAAAAPVMSKQATEALDAIGDGLSAAYQRTKNFAGELIGVLADMGKSASELSVRMLDHSAAFSDLGKGLPDVAAKHLEVAEAAKALALSEDDVASAIKQMDAEMKAANQTQVDGARITKEMARYVKEAADEQLAVWQEFRQANELAALEGSAQKLRQIDFDEEAVIASAGREYAANKDLYADMMAEVRKFYDGKRDAVEGSASDVLAALQAEKDATIAAMQEMSAAAAAANAAARGGTDILTMASSAMRGDMDDTIATVRTLSGELITAAEAASRFNATSSMSYDLSTNYGRAQIEATNPGITEFLRLGYSIAQAMQLLMGRRYNYQANVGAPDLPPWPPGMAKGGPVSAGMPYVVGERGSELFVPSVAGAIVPHGVSAGGVLVTQHIYVTQPLGTPGQIARVVGEAMMSQLRGAGVRLPAGA
jgi:hypothetical protein